jgi:hypothetical protein
MYCSPQVGQLSMVDGQELQQLSNYIKYGIPINYFQDSVNQREFPDTQTLPTIKETRK